MPMRLRSTCSTGPFLIPVLAATLLSLGGCGGGGDEASATSGTSNETVNAAAANATVVGGDSADAWDTSVTTAETVVATQATTVAPASVHVQAMAVQPQAVANVPVACPGGGSATLTITGGTVGSVLNGQWDEGEVYQLVFSGCRNATGAAAVDGTMTLTVTRADSQGTAFALTTQALAVNFARGAVTLDGSSTYARSTAGNGDGSTTVTAQVTVPSSTVTTVYQGRTSHYTLSQADWTRQTVWLDGLPQSATFNGTHTLSGTRPSSSFSYTVATRGGVQYGADGQPVSGAWTITLPTALLGVSIATGTATLTVDEGKDGTIDRTYTRSWATLQNDVS